MFKINQEVITPDGEGVITSFVPNKPIEVYVYLTSIEKLRVYNITTLTSKE